MARSSAAKCVVADDFVVGEFETWHVSKLGSEARAPLSALPAHDRLVWQVWRSDGGEPAGLPLSGGSATPVFEMRLPVGDSHVQEVGVDNGQLQHALSLCKRDQVRRERAPFRSLG